MRNILKALCLEDRVIDDLFELHPLRKIVCDQTLRQFIGGDRIQQVKLVCSVKSFFYRDRVQQIASHKFNSYLRRFRCIEIARKNANIHISFAELLNQFGTNHACTSGD